jgi:hypothetical protein
MRLYRAEGATLKAHDPPRKVPARGSDSIQFFEEVLGGAALGANPLLRQVLERSTGLHTVVRVSLLWIIYITAHRAPPHVHYLFTFPFYDWQFTHFRLPRRLLSCTPVARVLSFYECSL